jgi:mannose-6-phosphate isomerase-like protein (cupin superfamily)
MTCTRSIVAYAVAAASLLVPAGCSAHRRTIEITPARIQRVLDSNPVGEDEPFRAATLLNGHDFSLHVLQFRTGERRHIHRAHDLTFMVHRGQGELFIDDVRHPAQPGDVFHIPRRTPHYVVNTGVEPLVAVIIFTPEFDLTDSVPVEAE